MLRVIMADRDDIDDLAKFRSTNSGGYSFGVNSNWRSLLDTQFPISVKNELKAMMRLQFICDEYLSFYPTTYAQDCESLLDLEEMPMYSNKRNAFIQVRGEKEVLLYYRAYASVCIELLNVISSKDAEKIEQIEALAKSLCAEHHRSLHYFVKQQVLLYIRLLN